MSAVVPASTTYARKMEKTSIVNAKSISTTLDTYRVLRMFVKGGKNGMKANMDYGELLNSMTVEDAAEVLRNTRCYGTMDIAKNVILKALEEHPRWIPVSESIPPFGQDVLVCDLDGDMYITHLHLNGTWGFEYCGNKIKNVVAWQELPLPYKAESKE